MTLPDLASLLGVLFKAHPWHGVTLGDESPNIVTTYIEIVPSDTVKYELDKYTGHLKVDRPQAYSNICPTLYGFVPQTLSARRVAERCSERIGRIGIKGDDDPLDICVLSEKVFTRGDILLQARPIGGIRLIDKQESDDKILAVMKGDATYEGCRDISDCPRGVLDRLKHYFLTYKRAPDSDSAPCEIAEIYGRDEAHEMIRRAHEDYLEQYPDLEGRLSRELNSSSR